MAAPWQDPRTGIWYSRRRVPQKFRDALGLGEVMKWTLETKDKREAARRWPTALLKWEEMVTEWSRKCKIEQLTQERVEQLAALWTARILAGEPLKVIRPGHDSDIFDCFNFAELNTPENLEIAWTIIEDHANSTLKWAGVTADTDSYPGFVSYMRVPVMAAYLQADLDANGVVLPDVRAPLNAMGRSLPSVPPEFTEAAKGPVTGQSITDLYERWAKVSAVKPRTASETRYHVAGFRAFLGHDDAGRVTTADARNWRDSLVEKGTNNNTINARTGGVRQVFERAIADKLLSENPMAASLRLPKAAHRSWKPYSLDDAKRILSAARLEKRPSRRWAHWVMAHSGMRVGEALQLRGCDIRRDGATWFMDVNEDDETATVKNGQRRHVPVHPALEREGFIVYAQGIAAADSLFPDKKPDKHGKVGGRAWQVVGRWVRETVGITDPALAPDHSWRHYMEDALRDAAVPIDVRDAIIGHAQRSQGRGYGVKSEALTRLASDLAKVPSILD